MFPQTIFTSKRRLQIAAPVLGALLLFAGASQVSAVAQASGDDAKLQSEIQKKLDNKRYSGVQVSVQNGMATLSGSVDVFNDKEEADKRAHRVHGVQGVANQITVAAGDVPDQVLRDKLLKAIEYDRVGYGTTAFNAIAVSVQNGVVTLAGHAYGPVDAGSAVAVASNTKGVRDVVDDIQVDPVLPNDDRIRLQAFRTIYGFPSLNKYAIDPGKPIRISVVNGNVTLYGQVDSEADKDAAGIRANTVPGVFKVTNDLVVAGQGEARR
jgi:hyperosmotically inducible protein